VRGRGCLVYDESGREYLDMVAGIAVNLLGHAHPDVAAAVTRQAQTLIHTSNLYFTQPQVALAQRLVALSFPARVFLCNSGAEANETAIKLARKWGSRNRGGAFEIITTTGSFHGRTLATVTAGGQPKYSDPFQPLRTGRWFAHQHHGITPDVMTLAKGLGGGIPIGACLAAPKADVFEPGDHGSTFGGNPLACAAALAVLEVIERDGLIGHSAEMGEHLHDALKTIGARELRGVGLMRAAEFAEKRAKPFQQACLEAGLVVNAVDDHTVRFVPPLI